ncbi:acyl-CoA thioesterase domain-containing protein [Frankia sp. R82]|uniref:acyl-CoA thioesterase domain-containing protein n=1 Tax=Frankia sp. R82 TaxID=2950553 RepID=UPI002042F445|nr:acyl-CoA thioesterase domain-containing protein [Frankia sp. R82]MCM3887479.1 thioesterase family protein [Frankia sp. R82]
MTDPSEPGAVFSPVAPPAAGPAQATRPMSTGLDSQPRPRTPPGGDPVPTAVGELLALTVDPSARHGRFVAARHLRNTRGTLWGGFGLAAAVELVRRCGGRECLWAQTHFLGPVQAGETVDLTLEPYSGLSQAVVRATVNDRVVFVTTGSFGRPSGAVTRFAPAADWAPPPLDCPLRTFPDWLTFDRGGVMSLVEQRWARPQRTTLDGTPGHGRSALWLRMRTPGPSGRVLAGAELTAPVLAVLGDFAPVGLIEALGDITYGTSLDNQLRVVAAPSGEWILLDVRVEAVVRHVAQLRAEVYDATGALVATVGQSTLVHRVRPTQPTA